MEEPTTKRQRIDNTVDSPIITQSVREFILQVFEAAQYLDDDGDKPKYKIWDKLPEPWKHDRHVVLSAYQYGFVKHGALVQAFMSAQDDSGSSDEPLSATKQKKQEPQELQQTTTTVSGFLQQFSSLLTMPRTFSIKDRDELMPFLRHVPEECRSKVWKSTEFLHDDRVFVFEAARRSLIGLRDLPARFLDDAEFLSAVIRENPTTWTSLPSHWFPNPLYAKCIVKFENDLARQVWD
jgi:hypothetical protein